MSLQGILRRGKDAATREEGRRTRGFFAGGRTQEEETRWGVRRGDGTGSAATSPRPIATPRHEVRGEQKGEMGDGAAVPGGGRRRRRWWWREAAGYGGEGVRLVFVGGGGGL
jgi:hypothetical protein